jgi:hypothetical protein
MNMLGVGGDKHVLHMPNDNTNHPGIASWHCVANPYPESTFAHLRLKFCARVIREINRRIVYIRTNSRNDTHAAARWNALALERA